LMGTCASTIMVFLLGFACDPYKRCGKHSLIALLERVVSAHSIAARRLLQRLVRPDHLSGFAFLYSSNGRGRPGGGASLLWDATISHFPPHLSRTQVKMPSRG
jgi:hypothetical protein